jgi:TonB-dependent SusC/RagA subfamily outer membrane receptor
MIAQLMGYSLVTAGLLGLAALAAEAALRVYGQPARWVWILALVGSIGLPVSSLVAPGLRIESTNPTLIETIAGGAEAVLLPPVLQSLTAPRSWSSLVDLPLLLVWVAASVALLIVLVWSARRLARERIGWRHVRIGGTTAWLSEDTGPAVVGVLENSIVVPAWVLELEQDVQRLISLHEEEHLKAGDLRLMIAGLVLVLLAPWNVALWWQLRRLRVAVEADCDVRVLRKTSTLARRIHLMTWKPRMRLGRAVGAAALAATFGLLACEATSVTVVETEAPDAQLVAEGEGADTTLVYVRMVGGDDDEPLYIVDGVIVGRGMIDVDALHIESIEVVKGSAAQALYGDRAANGIIHITTKSGEELHEAVKLVRVKEKN